jgi:hypothetical protein
VPVTRAAARLAACPVRHSIRMSETQSRRTAAASRVLQLRIYNLDCVGCADVLLTLRSTLDGLAHLISLLHACPGPEGLEQAGQLPQESLDRALAVMKEASGNTGDCGQLIISMQLLRQVWDLIAAGASGAAAAQCSATKSSPGPLKGLEIRCGRAASVKSAAR